MTPTVATLDVHDERVASILTAILVVAGSADNRFGDFASLHEALGVLIEEVREFEDAVRKRQGDQSRQLDAEQEAIDIAAVALRIAVQARRLIR